MFVASILFADNIILVSPNRTGAQLMLTTCETWVKDNGITFSMDPCLSKRKTKLMRVTGTAKPWVTHVPLILDGRELAYVDSWVHLRHILPNDGRMNNDIQIKIMIYISKCNKMKESFNFWHPAEIQIILTFCSAFYGSNLWYFESEEAMKIYNLWNITVRDVYDLPRMTRRYIIEQLISVHHRFKVDNITWTCWGVHLNQPESWQLWYKVKSVWSDICRCQLIRLKVQLITTANVSNNVYLVEFWKCLIPEFLIILLTMLQF